MELYSHLLVNIMFLVLNCQRVWAIVKSSSYKILSVVCRWSVGGLSVVCRTTVGRFVSQETKQKHFLQIAIKGEKLFTYYSVTSFGNCEKWQRYVESKQWQLFNVCFQEGSGRVGRPFYLTLPSLVLFIAPFVFLVAS